jgi:hypothetical protein
MSSEFPVSFKFTLDDQLTSAAEGMQSALDGVANSIQVTTEDMTQMEEGLQQAADGSYTLSEATADMGDSMASASSQADDINESYGYVGETADTTNGSFKNSVMTMNSMAQTGANLYLITDRIEKSETSLDAANLKVQKSAQAVTTAQENSKKAGEELDKATDDLAAAVDEYGAGSNEATDAQKKLDDATVKYNDSLNKLQIAQDGSTLAQQRQKQAQDDVNKTMLMSALTVIPSVISIVEMASNATKIWSGIQAAFNIIMDANPIILVGLAIAGLVALIIYAYNACPPFRDAINAIGQALGAVLGPAIDAIKSGLEWLWNNVFVPLGAFLGDVFNAYIQGLSIVFGYLGQAVNAIYNALYWLWTNVFVPLGNFISGVFAGYINALISVWNVLVGSVNAVYNAFNWLWNNILIPIANFFNGTLKSAINGIMTVLKPVIDGINTLINAGKTVGGAIGGALHAIGLAEGGIVTQPTYALIGEAGPEAVVPLSGAKSSIVQQENIESLNMETVTAKDSGESRSSGDVNFAVKVNVNIPSITTKMSKQDIIDAVTQGVKNGQGEALITAMNQLSARKGLRR